ncbi:MAG: phage holin family protein [Actinobacteria bacterium]|nr:phage holin family protein [Actinomycetota bacterium]MCB9411395.1 phage holin family protein [Actinomycetota bacterium]
MAATARQQSEPSIPELVTSATADVKLLISDQIALTKMELQSSARTAGKSMALLAVAAFLGVLFFVFLLVTIAYVLVAVGLPVWAGFGIVALVLGIVAAILGIVGKKRMESLQGPQESIAQIEATKQALTSQLGK